MQTFIPFQASEPSGNIVLTITWQWLQSHQPSSPQLVKSKHLINVIKQTLIEENVFSAVRIWPYGQVHNQLLTPL